MEPVHHKFEQNLILHTFSAPRLFHYFINHLKMGWLDKFRKKKSSGASPYDTTIHNNEISIIEPSGMVKKISLNDLETIKILVTTDGPELPDVWLNLNGNGKSLMIPQGYPGYDQVYDIVSKFSGFDFKAVIQAMTAVPDIGQEFLLWQNKKAESSHSESIISPEDDGEIGKWGFLISVTGESIRIDHPERKTESIKWDQIEEIGMMKTLGGGVAPDFWLALIGVGTGCLIPQGVKGYKTVMGIVSRYDGFDLNKMVEVFNAEDDTPLILWKRTSGSGRRAPHG